MKTLMFGAIDKMKTDKMKTLMFGAIDTFVISGDSKSYASDTFFMPLFHSISEKASHFGIFYDQLSNV
jgi:hypothetical protein